ncbi:beta-1,3-glucan-binding protein-like [Corticium candelabrum]|uniref:beta-1,3-glucan-binding protein-like n=1 Tax=Corticium candelabrum TaxID=121492 RepID=UPI002E270A35|nr:beta-1,3-glucan-binding protein-like [Corticium candelabrum]
MSRISVEMRLSVTSVFTVVLLVAAQQDVCVKGELLFEEDFNVFNLSVWQHELTMSGGGNWEFQLYDNNRANSYVRDGILYIKPTLLSDAIGEANVQNGYTMNMWGGTPADLCTGNHFYGCLRTSGAGGNVLNPIRSARIRTVKSFSFKYGRVEVKAKLPKGDWLWPAIWMLPTYNQYGGWPSSGEIDIMESRGNNASYPAGGVDAFGSTLHWGPYALENGYAKTTVQKKLDSGDFSQDFHIYGLIWNETYIGTYLDDPSNVTLSVPITESFWDRGGYAGKNYDNPWAAGGRNAPFDQEFYFVINLAVGGTNGYFPDNQGGKPWSNLSPHSVNEFWNDKSSWYSTWNGEEAALKVDSVRVWDLSISTTMSTTKSTSDALSVEVSFMHFCCAALVFLLGACFY